MYDNLSKEELIKLLAKAESKNTNLESKNTNLESKNTNLESKNTNLESENANLESENANLESKNTNLESKNTNLESENANLESIINKLEIKNANVEAQLREVFKKLDEALKKIENELQSKRVIIARQFDKKSESNKEVVINEVDVESSITLPMVKKTKKVGRKDGFSFKDKFDNLDSSIVRETVIIACEDTKCSDCDDLLSDYGYSSTYKIEIIPSQIKVIEYQFERKICKPCNKVYKGVDNNDPYPDSHLTPSLASEILNNKYVLGIPLYRMEDYYTKLGLTISRQLMANYAIQVASDLEPLYDLMKNHLINNKAKVIHCDETTLKVIKTTDEERSKCYMWLYSSSFYDVPIYIYEFQESRQGIHPKEFLKDYDGYIVTDGYQSYLSIPNVTMSACWAHARRKFYDIVKTLSNEQLKKSVAQKAINIIDKLFALEAAYRVKKLNPLDIYNERQIKSLPIVNEYELFLNETSYETNSVLGKAIEYSKSLLPNLKNFLKDGHIDISNNLAERAIKPFVIMRKNFLFSYTVNGAQASAINFSIIQSARANGLDVKKYLEYVLTTLPNITIKQLPDLLPWSANIAKLFRITSDKR